MKVAAKDDKVLQEINYLRQNLHSLNAHEKRELLRLLDLQAKRAAVTKAQTDLITFAKEVYPGYKVGQHHRKLASLFEEIASGKKKRIIVNIAPRHGKSELTSYLFPAWFLGRFPDKKIIMATHTATLSESFGRRVRNLIASKEYAEFFPDTRIAEDSKSAGSWGTDQGGQYYAVGVGGALAGRGADLLIIDDPHSEQDVKTGSTNVFDNAFAWYQTGPRQRLMPGGAIVVVMTRWSLLDLTGRLVDYGIKNPQADQWEVVEFPAILFENEAREKSLWPEQWPLEELKRARESIDPRYWASQYQQQPTADAAQIIKYEDWQVWERDDPPECSYLIHSWDTAFEAKNSADYSAYTCWGVFERENDEGRPENNLIMLDAFKARMEFPELKKVVIDHYKRWRPDTLLIERRASGAPLIQELRISGIPVSDFTPARAKTGVNADKIARANAVSDIFKSGMVWIPDKRWAAEVRRECADFPVGTHDDYVDSVVQALLRFREGGLISTANDNKLDDDWMDAVIRRRRGRYY